MSLGADGNWNPVTGRRAADANTSPMQRRPSARSRWSFWSPPDRRHSLEQYSPRMWPAEADREQTAASHDFRSSALIRATAIRARALPQACCFKAVDEVLRRDPGEKDVGTTREPPSPGVRVPQRLRRFRHRQFLVRLEQLNCRPRTQNKTEHTGSHDIV
jgi:hypothetical protein